tara:strand:- start:19 stop:264 length:246 start_codon:yes stop_codon:yes gene_type:complete
MYFARGNLDHDTNYKSLFLALFSAQLGRLDQKEINPPKETNSPVVVCSECIAKIKPNMINAKPHKLLINNNQIINASLSKM